MKIAVVGTGYVGLVTGTCLAETGNQVTCVDIDEAKVKKMRNGTVPIYEPHLDVLFQRNIKHERLSFTTSIEEAIKESQIIFLALPTPPGEDGSADLSYILGVAEQLSKIIDNYKVIVDKSTVPVGTARRITDILSSKLSNDLFDVVSNPEFLREGFAVDDFLKPDRVVIGTKSEKAKKIMGDLYRPYVRQGNPIIFMDEESAELTKYAANSFLATKITFMNEVANFCEKVGADVDKVRLGMGSDPRIGKRFLFPGVGYGGSCFPKDVQALYKSGQDSKYDFHILKSVMNVNEKQKVILVPKIIEYFKGSIKDKKIALWGLSFKPDTDDIREAPSLYIIDALLELGARITVFDPEAMDNVKEIYGQQISYSDNRDDTFEDADALVIVTEWQVFRNPDFNLMSEKMKRKVIFDGRNLFDIDEMKERGFYYNSIGRKLVYV